LRECIFVAGGLVEEACALAGMPAPDDLDLYLTRLFLPVEGAVLAANAGAENRQWLKAHLGDVVLRPVARDDLLAAIRRRYGAALLDQAIFSLAHRFPQLSARTVITRPQIVTGAIAASLCALALIVDPLHTLRAIVALLSLAFVASGVFRACLAFFGTMRPASNIQTMPCDAGLPVYTILVPLYREAAVLPALVAALRAMDYPSALLDIKLVVEEDDAPTGARRRAV
jgi:hypothetical protein